MANIITDLTNLKINYLTQALYDQALAAGQINENELYFVSDSPPATNIVVSSVQPSGQKNGDLWYQII